MEKLFLFPGRYCLLAFTNLYYLSHFKQNAIRDLYIRRVEENFKNEPKSQTTCMCKAYIKRICIKKEHSRDFLFPSNGGI